MHAGGKSSSAWKAGRCSRPGGDEGLSELLEDGFNLHAFPAAAGWPCQSMLRNLQLYCYRVFSRFCTCARVFMRCMPNSRCRELSTRFPAADEEILISPSARELSPYEWPNGKSHPSPAKRPRPRQTRFLGCSQGHCFGLQIYSYHRSSRGSKRL